MKDGVSVDDRQLLQRFVEHDSQEAFAALTARYLSLVYSVCRRELADDQMAEDVTQAVFLILARKAPTLGRNVVLSGWLFQTARFAAKNARLQAQRRAAYEQKAAQMMQQQSEAREDAAWAEIEPLLNQSLAALREGERECVLLRFFQGLSFAEAGATLGLSEEAARKRVGRALEKMRAFLSKEGVVIPGVALAALLSTHAVRSVPAYVAEAAARLSTAILPDSLSAFLEGTLYTMRIAKMKAVAGGISLLLIGLGSISYLATTLAAKPTRKTILSKTPALVTSSKAVKPVVEPVSIDPKARKLLEQMAASYRRLSSYSGGTNFLVANGAGGVQALRRHELEPQVKMTVALDRPNRVAVRVKGSSSYVYGAMVSPKRLPSRMALTTMRCGHRRPKRRPTICTVGFRQMPFCGLWERAECWLPTDISPSC